MHTHNFSDSWIEWVRSNLTIDDAEGVQHTKLLETMYGTSDKENQGWQGRAGSPTSALRPAALVETSAPCPAAPSASGAARVTTRGLA